MIHKYKYNDLTWVDVESPTQEEITGLVKEYSLHPIVGEELLTPNSEPRVEVHKSYIYLTLDMPIRTNGVGHAVVMKKEIDFVIGKKFIITTKYDAIEPLHNFSKVFETNSIIDKKGIGEHAGFIFYFMLKKLYRHVRRDMHNTREELISAEKNIFEGEERHMVTELSRIGREIIDMKQALRPHIDVLNVANVGLLKLFGANFKTQTSDIVAEYEDVNESALNIHELMLELRETNDSLLSAKQNEVMKNLTLMAFVTFPLSLIIAVLGLRTAHTPLVNGNYGFYIIASLVILAAAGMIWFFKKKKWL